MSTQQQQSGRLAATMRTMLGRLRIWTRDYVDALRGQLRSVVHRARTFDTSAPDGGVTVVLLPGVYERWRYLEPLARRLREHGFGVRAVPALGWNSAPFSTAAPLVRTVIDRLGGDVVLVGHSKGGLTGKRVLVEWERDRLGDDLPTGVRLAGLVTVATPFGGSTRARLLPWWRTLRELHDGSSALTELAAEQAANAHIVELVPSWDPHIPSHTPLPGSQVVRLRAAGHFTSLDSPETFEQIVAAIDLLVAKAPPDRPDHC